MPELTFYYMDTCPYCQKVLKYLQQNDIDIPRKNTMESNESRKELLQVGGKTQVPCLVIDGKALYESEDILKWLKQNGEFLK